MSQFIQLLAVQNQYIVQNAADTHSAVKQLVNSLFGYGPDSVVHIVDNIQFRTNGIDLYVQQLTSTDFMVFITCKLNMES